MLVRAEDLGVRLGGRVVFSGLEFAWEGPGTIAVTGANGSGKTTLLKVLAGLLAAGRGRVTWEDAGRALRPVDARARLGFVSSELGLYEDLSAHENLAFFAQARGQAWRRADGEAWFERLGLGGRGDERVAGYSSGMKQRVKLAFALMAKPGLVLLDEPGSNLDESGRSLLAGLVAEAGASALVVVATNDPAEAAWATSRLELPS
ncbi:MAG: ABC transporter ATP-binding protein [Candidatus Eisenbacteria bacterium]